MYIVHTNIQRYNVNCTIHTHTQITSKNTWFLLNTGEPEEHDDPAALLLLSLLVPCAQTRPRLRHQAGQLNRTFSVYLELSKGIAHNLTHFAMTSGLTEAMPPRTPSPVRQGWYNAMQ